MSEPSEEEYYRAVLNLLQRWQSSKWAWQRYIGRIVYRKELEHRDLMKRLQADVERRKKKT